MKSRILFSPESLRDIEEIWDYIFTELENPDATERTVQNILDAVDRLEDFPELGALLSSVAEVESEYRFLLSGNYMIFYRAGGNYIYIDRILYGRRDYLRVLFPDLPGDDANT